jgi:hypothetical protein
MRLEKHMMIMRISGVERGFYRSAKGALKPFPFSKRAFINAEDIPSFL